MTSSDKPLQMPYGIVSPGFRGNIKAALNAVLRPAGLEISSLITRRIEDARLQKLSNREHWAEPRYLHGLALNDELILQFLSETCGPYEADYEKFEVSANGDSNYFLKNGWFESVDAEILYGVIRRFQPVNILEVGGGFSTRVMRRAINEGKLLTKITSIDPNPNSSVLPYADEYIKSLVEDVDISRIVNLLKAGDILFIDSSHLVKTGGDVPYLFLEVLPRLQASVFIHVHDIFFPFDYPEEFVFQGWSWNEQYLVQAFLAYNQTFEIIWPARYMWEYYRAQIERLIPARQFPVRPSSLWLKKKT
jgi:hypothetical protein